MRSDRATSLARHRVPGVRPEAAARFQPEPVCSISVCRLASTETRIGPIIALKKPVVSNSLAHGIACGSWELSVNDVLKRLMLHKATDVPTISAVITGVRSRRILRSSTPTAVRKPGADDCREPGEP